MLPACWERPAASAPRGAESLSPSLSLTNCFGNQKTLAYALFRDQGVMRLGLLGHSGASDRRQHLAGAWQLGSHDECLGWDRVMFAKLLRLWTCTSCYRLCGFRRKSWGQGSGWGLSGCGQAHLFLTAFKFCPLVSLPLNSLLLSEDWRAPPLTLKTESHCVAQVGLQLTILLSLPLSIGITGLQPE